MQTFECDEFSLDVNGDAKQNPLLAPNQPPADTESDPATRETVDFIDPAWFAD